METKVIRIEPQNCQSKITSRNNDSHQKYFSMKDEVPIK